MNGKKEACLLCGKQYEHRKMFQGGSIREGIFNQIKDDHPKFSEHSPICYKCHDKERAEFITKTLRKEEAAIGKVETDVLKSLKKQDILTRRMYQQYKEKPTFANKVSDKLAEFGGSWTFIIAFTIFLFGWMGVNAILLATRPFDPYPFILLNLVLSTLAAIQAPIIMMSQNRQEERDRLSAEHDYKINLKAELEIRHLHEKLDLLLKDHWKRLLHIQQMQVDVLDELKRKKNKK